MEGLVEVDLRKINTLETTIEHIKNILIDKTYGKEKG